MSAPLEAAERLAAGGHLARPGVRQQLPTLLGPDWPAFAAKHGLDAAEFGAGAGAGSVAVMSREVLQHYIRNAGPPAAPARPAGGPGTELRALLKELGVTEKTGCGCGDRAQAMDRWGSAGTRDNRAQVVEWLRGNAARLGWVERLRMAARAVSAGALSWLDPTDIYGSIVTEAVRRAEAKGL